MRRRCRRLFRNLVGELLLHVDVAERRIRTQRRFPTHHPADILHPMNAAASIDRRMQGAEHDARAAVTARHQQHIGHCALRIQAFIEEWRRLLAAAVPIRQGHHAHDGRTAAVHPSAPAEDSAQAHADGRVAGCRHVHRGLQLRGINTADAFDDAINVIAVSPVQDQRVPLKTGNTAGINLAHQTAPCTCTNGAGSDFEAAGVAAAGNDRKSSSKVRSSTGASSGM